MGDEQSKREKPGIVRRGASKGMRLIVGIVGGVALLLLGFYILVWGEVDTAIQSAVNLNEATALDGDLVTYTGRLTANRNAVDEAFVPTENAVSSTPAYAVIQRHVQTCAFMEEKEQDVMYSKRWVSDIDVPDSSTFKQKGYDNIRGLLSSGLSVGQGLSVGDAEEVAFQIQFSRGQLQVLAMDDIVPKKSEVRGARHVDQQWVYINRHCSPEKGDIGGQRVRFSVLRPGALVTVFGIKNGNAIKAYHDAVYLSNGARETLIEQVRTSENDNIWMFWCAGGLAIWIGLYLIITPLLVLITWIPLLGGLVKGAATVITFLVALALTAGFVFWGWGMDTWLQWFGGLVQ